MRHFAAHRKRWIFLMLILLPIATLAICEIAGWPFLRGPTERILARQLERSVRIEPPFRLHILGSLRLKAGRLLISAPPEFDVPHFLDAQDITLKLRYSDLWHFKQSGNLRIAVFDVGKIDAQLLRTADGDASWRLGKRETKEGSPQLPSVDLLGVRQGSLIFRDPGLDADLRATFDTQEGAESAAPVSHMRAQGRFRKRPFQAEVSTNGWLPAADQSGNAPPVAAKAWLTYGGVRADFDGAVKDLLGRQGIKGFVAVRGPSLGLLGQLTDSPLPTTTPFLLQGSIDKGPDVWQVAVDKIQVGQSNLSARFTYVPESKPPRLNGQLTGSNFALADLAPTFGTRSEEGKPVPPRPGRLFPNRPLDLPSLRNLNANITINIDRVDLGSAFKEPIQPFKANLSLDGGQLGLAKVDARTAKGRLSGNISVDARQDMPHWRSDLAWEGIHLEDWLKNGKDRGKGSKQAKADSQEPPYLTGVLQGRAKLTGQGKSTAQLLGSIDGEITMFVKNGTLSHLVIEVLGLDVAQGLGLVIKGDESMPMRCAVVDLQAKNGEIRPKVALIDTPVTTILADGSLNLMKESLDFRVTAKPKNISPFTVRSPIRIQGSLVAPEAGPEKGPIAARVIGGVALAFVNPLAAIIPFLDPGDAKESPCTQALATLKR